MAKGNDAAPTPRADDAGGDRRGVAALTSGPLPQIPGLLSTGVAERLESFILASGLRSGDKLPSERDLAERFGVSRTAVREAVKLLSERGLIRSSVGRGLFVGDADTASILASLNVLLHLRGGRIGYIVDVRDALETLAARLAATAATAEDLAALRAALATMERDRHLPGGYGDPGTAFHLALARASGNPLLAALLEPTMVLWRRTVGALPGLPRIGTAEGLRNHQRIMAALEARDPDAAVAAVERHCAHLRQLYARLSPDWADAPFGEMHPRTQEG